MKKFIASIIAMLAAAGSASALTTVPNDIEALPEGYGFSVVSHDEASGVWTLEVCNTDGQGLAPWLRLAPIAEPVPEECTVISFDYRTTHPAYNIEMTGYKLFLGNSTQHFSTGLPMTVSDQWQTFRFYIGKYRTRNGSVRMLNKAGQYQEFKFYDLPEGARVELRNFRYEEDEQPFAAALVSADGPCVIEAENFNMSASGNTGAVSNQYALPEMTPYRNPTGDQFPIFAWGSVSYENTLGDQGVVDQYRELAECGFNLSLGTPWPGIDLTLLQEGGAMANTMWIDPCKDLDMWIIVKAGLDDSNWEQLVERYSKSPRLAGYFIKDEPFYNDFPYMAAKVKRLRSADKEHLFYGNLLSSEVMRTFNIGSYEDYINRSVREIGLGFLSFDFYPVREVIATGEIQLMKDFLESLEIMAKMSKYYRQPFWAFIHSVESNCGVSTYRYPTPTEEHMRLQAFANLAYGCQGLQYFTYKCPYDPSYNYTNAPISLDNERTPTWYMVQNINREVQALSWVFLGAEMVCVGHTNSELPLGTVPLRADMLPDGVASVASDGQGVCCSTLKNGRNLFFMSVNLDVKNSQLLTLVTDRETLRVMPDGSTVPLAAGTHTFPLAVGGYVLLQTSDCEADTVIERPAEPVRSDYRPDRPNVIVTTSEEASNGHYLPHMGDAAWDVFSQQHSDFGGHVISRRQAVDNWGCSYNYFAEVAEDMDADIYIGYSVPEDEYNLVKSVGAPPGYNYIVEGDERLDWPAKYAASLTLDIDGETIGCCAGTDVLYLSPRESMGHGPQPDFANVRLTAGFHNIVVTSLCSPWNFDYIRIVPAGMSPGGIADFANVGFSAVGVKGGVEIRSESRFEVCSLAGMTVAAGTGPCRVGLARGVYIVRGADGGVAKIVVK